MHCYYTLAAATRLAAVIGEIPDSPRRSHAELVAWMDECGIDPADILNSEPRILLRRIRALLQIHRSPPVRAA